MNTPEGIEAMLKELPSSDAASLLMSAYPLDAPNYSDALRLIAHHSWKRADQIRLARFYLRKMPFASAKPYEIFATLMSLPTLVSVVREVLSEEPGVRRLVAYHLAPALKKNARTEHDRAVVNEFIAELCPCRSD